MAADPASLALSFVALDNGDLLDHHAQARQIGAAGEENVDRFTPLALDGVHLREDAAARAADAKPDAAGAKAQPAGSKAEAATK